MPPPTRLLLRIFSWWTKWLIIQSEIVKTLNGKDAAPRHCYEFYENAFLCRSFLLGRQSPEYWPLRVMGRGINRILTYFLKMRWDLLEVVF